MKFKISLILLALIAGNSLLAATNYADSKPFGDTDKWAVNSDKLIIREWWKSVTPTELNPVYRAANEKVAIVSANNKQVK